jgi:hypothetical protein
VLAAELDAAVAVLAEKLFNKLSRCTCYAKQQLNFWRDLSWGLTAGHARDWLTVHMSSAETQDGINAFLQKRPMDYAGRRAQAAQPQTKTCANCGMAGLPLASVTCLRCGNRLEPEGNPSGR